MWGERVVSVVYGTVCTGEVECAEGILTDAKCSRHYAVKAVKLYCKY